MVPHLGEAITESSGVSTVCGYTKDTSEAPENNINPKRKYKEKQNTGVNHLGINWEVEFHKILNRVRFNYRKDNYTKDLRNMAY